MHSNTFLNKKSTKKLKQGFGLIELLVSISIMILVIGVVLSQQKAFNGAVLLRGQAYEIALQAREVQLRAVSVINRDNSTDFREVYGIYFNELIPNTYNIFRDGSTIDGYDAGEEFGIQGQLDKRFEVDDLRLVGSTPSSPGNISVVFERPNFDARFFVSGVEDTSATSLEVDIWLKGATGTGPGAIRTLEITKTGQISVKEIP